MPTIDLIEPERVLVELATERYNALVAQAQEILEQAEGIRASAYTAIVKRALREKALSSAKGLKGPPEIIREDGLAAQLVWADVPTNGGKNRLTEESTEHKNGASLPT